ncbi:glycosyltransferase [Candidatus Sumerlaeota bacterium]|nr:glycosyltransferase [Candidatus Sumerlaeota bacterium]
MADRPRVLEVIFGNTLGGAEVLLRELIRVADTSRFEWHVCLLRRGATLEAFEALDAEFSLHHVHCGRGLDLGCISRLTRLMRDLRPQVVHTHLFRADVHGRWAARRARVPVIVSTVHAHTTRHSGWLRDAMDRWTARFADRIIGCTETITEITARRLRLPPGKAITIPNGTPLESFQRAQASESLRESLGLAPGEPVVGTVGRLAAEKNQIDFLRMAERVLRRHPGTRFLIVGEGDLRGELEAAARDLGVGERVVFTGARSDIPDLMALMDVFALCSLWEALPITLLEAMAAGLPCVSADVGGCRDLVRPGETGWLVPPRDAEALAGAVCEALERGDEARRRAEAARALVLERHTIGRCAQAHADLYEKLLREKGIHC